jgi:hypothetical protein
MSIKHIQLDKLLKAFFLPENKRIALLRDDIRSEIAKEQGSDSGGGNFYTPFWSNAKEHIHGTADLRLKTAQRIEMNERRRRLYPLLQNGFLHWWENKRRWTNVDFVVDDVAPKGRYRFDDLDAIVKVENLVSVSIGENRKRLIYPYFYEEPIVNDAMSRLGLWLMSEALPGHGPGDMRILDIPRSNANSIGDLPLRGDEEAQFIFHYERLIDLWEQLREEY